MNTLDICLNTCIKEANQQMMTDLSGKNVLTFVDMYTCWLRNTDPRTAMRPSGSVLFIIAGLCSGPVIIYLIDQAAFNSGDECKVRVNRLKICGLVHCHKTLVHQRKLWPVHLFDSCDVALSDWC